MAILKSFRFRPALLDSLPGYTRQQCGQDVAAGLTVGVLALPLAMAFAIASGVTPSAGLWTAIIAGFIISALGGSRVQIGGPTGAFIPILYVIAERHGVANLLAATFMAGIILFAMGAARLGSLIRLIPISVVIGFTNGIAVVIFLSQIRDFFGLDVDSMPGEFFARMKILWSHSGSFDAATTALGLGSFALIMGWGALAQRYPRLGLIPGQLLGLLGGTLACALLSLPVETLGSRFNGIPQGLPALHLPLPDIERLGRLLVPALTIALLGAIESLLSARVADGYLEERHDPNQELMAQGLANMAVPFFGGIAATGAIARTATNIRAGGRTPIAGLVHAGVLLLVVLVAAPLAAYVPIATLAAVVMVTAIRMGEWHEFSRLKHFSWHYRSILLTTFLVTVLFDLTIAVELGMVLASLFFIYRMQSLSSADVAMPDLPAGVEVHRLHGSIFFGSVGKLDVQVGADVSASKILILDLQDVLSIDTTGIDWLASVHKAQQKKHGRLVLCAARPQAHSLLQRSGLLQRLGEGACVADVAAALQGLDAVHG